MYVDQEPNISQLLNHMELPRTKEHKRLHFQRIFESVRDKSREALNSDVQKQISHL